MPDERFPDFASFYPFYLSQHSNRNCRRMHFIGTSLALGFMLQFLLTFDWRWLLPMWTVPYIFAWLGHFIFEKNRPATFTYPVWSFLGDWKMFAQMLQGKISF